MSRPKRYLIRNLDDQGYLETFLVSAVASILFVRFVLYLTGFPQVGGKGLHIAHLLWGGLLMVVGIVMLFNYLDRDSHRIASLVSGIGFGLFMDELGKFITSDNNYFFRPAAAIIYTVFAVMYLSFRLLQRERNVADREYLINSIESFKEAVIRGFDRSYMDRARVYLGQDHSDDPVTRAVRELMAEFHDPPPEPAHRVERLRDRLEQVYSGLVCTKRFERVVIVLFLIEALVTLAVAVLVTAAMTGFALPSRLGISSATASYTKLAAVLFALIASVLVFAGAILMVRSPLTAYRMFKVAMLVSIFLTQVFEFYYIQFHALFGLTFNILGLMAVDTLITQERRRMRRDGQSRAAPAQVEWSESAASPSLAGSRSDESPLTPGKT